MTKIKQKKDYSEIILKKDVTKKHAKGLRNELLSILKNPKQKIRINFKKVQSIDSLGIIVLMKCQNFMNEYGNCLELYNVSNEFVNMFKILSLDKHFKISGISTKKGGKRK